MGHRKGICSHSIGAPDTLPVLKHRHRSQAKKRIGYKTNNIEGLNDECASVHNSVSCINFCYYLGDYVMMLGDDLSSAA